MSKMTLAHYWEKFNRDDLDYLLYVLKDKSKDRNNLHYGLLPFIPADEAYRAASSYFLSMRYQTPEGMLIAQRLLQILRAHRPWVD